MLGLLTKSGCNVCPYLRQSINKQRAALLAWQPLPHS